MTAALSGRASAPVADVVAMANRVNEFGGAVRAITVDGPALHNRGANGAWELAA